MTTISNKRAKEIYEASGLTPFQFGKAVGVSSRTVQYWLSGDTRRNPSPLARTQLRRIELSLIKKGRVDKADEA